MSFRSRSGVFATTPALSWWGAISILFIAFAALILFSLLKFHSGQLFRPGARAEVEHSRSTNPQQGWGDRFEDGTPDFLRLSDPADQAAFRRWFTLIAEYQTVPTSGLVVIRAVMRIDRSQHARRYDPIMTIAGLSHEEAVVRSFILKDRQERCAYLLGHTKHRHKFTDELAHFKWLDDRFAHPIPSSRAHTAAELVALLQHKGAGKTVWVISDDPSIDAREMPVDVAMKHIWGSEIGTILSCVPGKLGFFSGEEMKSERLLVRP